MERLRDKYDKDIRIITGMISDLRDDKIGIGMELIQIEQLLEREKK